MMFEQRARNIEIHTLYTAYKVEYVITFYCLSVLVNKQILC